VSRLREWSKGISKKRHELATLLVGFILFAILWGLVIDVIQVRGFARTVVGGVAGFGAFGAFLAFGLKLSKSWQMKKTRKKRKLPGWPGFLESCFGSPFTPFGFLGFLGIRAFMHHEPVSLFYFCFFFLFSQFGHLRKELYYLGSLGLLGVLLPTLYVLGLLAV
jgi:hypothetical protein